MVVVIAWVPAVRRSQSRLFSSARPQIKPDRGALMRPEKLPGLADASDLAFETGRPSGRKQPFRIGADARLAAAGAMMS
jgi:hypothetical protein